MKFDNYGAFGALVLAAALQAALSGCEKREPAASNVGTQARAVAGADCRASADCARGMFCLAPGESPGCGTCFIGESCSADADCQPHGSTFICGRPPCACSTTCVAGCTADDQCKVGEACGGDHHCGPQACQVDDDCPSNFACNAGGCGRRACSRDDDCDGYCVNNQCYDALGACTVPPV